MLRSRVNVAVEPVTTLLYFLAPASSPIPFDRELPQEIHVLCRNTRLIAMQPRAETLWNR